MPESSGTLNSHDEHMRKRDHEETVSWQADHQKTVLWHDALSGFAGGAVGIVLSNPLDLLKVREQVASAYGPLPAPSSKAVHPRAGDAKLLAQEGIWRGLHMLYRKEGWRVLFAGTLGPVAMYAPLDAFFFSAWGRAMDRQEQDRDDPSSLKASAVAGGIAGALCAVAQTPIEVVKVRAQMERQGVGQKRKGTIGITRDIVIKEGIRGFFVGFLPTLIRDTFANAVFFPTYHACRRLVRGEHPFLTRREALERQAHGVPSIFRVAPLDEADCMTGTEFVRIMAASGIAGAACMIATYPLDVIKTQAQQSVKANAAGERLDVSMRALMTRIWQEGRLHNASQYSRPLRTIARFRGFSRGIKLGIATSALQSALIIPIFELGVHLLR